MLEDRDEIKELTSKYFWHAVRGETEGMAACFTIDGAFDARPAGGPYRAQGYEELVKYFNLVMKPVPSAIPMAHNHIIKLNGDDASGTCVLATPIGGRLGGGFVGYYHDRYRRAGEKWLFAERVFDNYVEFTKRDGVEVKPVEV